MICLTRPTRAAAFLFLLAGVLSCSSATEPRAAACDPRAADVLSPARRDSLPAPLSAFRTIDDASADIARQAPGGYAGIYRDDAGRLVVLLRDTVNAASTLRALTPLLATVYGGNIGSLDGARVVSARWDFAQLQDWYRYLSLHVWPVANVTVTDIDEMHNQLLFGVRDDATRTRLELLLRSLDVPCDLVAVKIVAQTIAF